MIIDVVSKEIVQRVHFSVPGLGQEKIALISLLAASIQCTILVVSEALTTHLPSGLTAIPSGSTPTA
jgi:hypothetical protein